MCNFLEKVSSENEAHGKEMVKTMLLQAAHILPKIGKGTSANADI